MILLFTASDFVSIASHIHNWVLFLFGSIPSFFLELFLHWSPVAYWASPNLGSSSFSVLSFCLFMLFMGFSRQEYWSGLPFPSPVLIVVSIKNIHCPPCLFMLCTIGLGLRRPGAIFFCLLWFFFLYLKFFLIFNGLSKTYIKILSKIYIKMILSKTYIKTI